MICASTVTDRSVGGVCNRQIDHKNQLGVGLVEVLIALVILAFGALAIVNLQTASAVAISSSADHFKINELSQGIIEHLKADSNRAIAGNYNTAFSEDAASASIPTDIAQKINEWKQATSRSLPQGQAQIKCSTSECNVGFKWHESSHSGIDNQVYNLKSPI